MAGSYYPRSFSKLILLGIFVVVLPIGVAFYNTARHLESLATRSQEAVDHAMIMTAGCRKLVDATDDLERGVQQFVLNGTDKELETYRTQHKNFQTTLNALRQQANDDTTQVKLRQLRDVEQAIYDRVAHGATALPISPPVSEQAELQALAQALLEDSNAHIRQEIDHMRTTAQDASHAMIQQLLVVVPLAILFAFGFTAFITRPFTQINSAIRVMGRGDLNRAVRISGPSDLVDLGRQLDWLRRRLLELEEGKKRFLQHVSHELKTPLAALREGSDLLADEVGGSLSDQQREITTILRNKSMQLQRMIENLLNYSAGDAARYNRSLLHVQPVSLRTLLASVFEDHRLVAQGKGLRWQLAAQDVVVLADAEKLRIVFDNVISNAIKFSPEAGTVRASASAEGPLALVQIDDEGPGIAEEDRERIFDPFYRTRTPQHGPVKGTGLGLAIMREFVLAHGGSVRVTEHRPRGTSFLINLPNPGMGGESPASDTGSKS